MLAFLLACAQTPPAGDGQPDDDTGTPGGDAVAVKLSETSDLCAYDDGVIADTDPVEAPEGYVGDFWPEVYAPCLDGVFEIEGRVIEHPDGHLEDAYAFATFFAVTQPDEEWDEGEWLDTLDGDDDCGLARLGRNGLATEGDLRWLDPGAVDLVAPSGTTALDRAEGGTVLNWETWPAAAEYGGSYGLSVAGSTGSGDWDGFDAIALPDLVTLPDALALTSPAGLGPGAALSRADTELVWTGTSDQLVEIRFDAEVGDESYMLRCAATDDGSFTIPGSLLSQFPAGAEGNLGIYRRDDEWVGTRLGRSVHAIGVVRYEAWDVTVP